MILLSGSLAYDYIMNFPDSFRHHILPDQIHILNVCFVVNKLEKNFGGTAGNIAYTMKLLGGDPLILGVLGMDGQPYAAQLLAQSISTSQIRTSGEKLTASAYVTTDQDDNQITAFYSGAGDEAMELSIDDMAETPSFAMISPAKKEAMIRHAKECYEQKIPFCFDPGQQITALLPQEVMRIVGQAKFLIGNDYEIKLIEQKTGWDEQELLNHVEVLIKTLGEKGSIILTKKEMIDIAPCPPLSMDDPTGAGDAYRAGFFTAYTKGLDLKTCGQVGSVAAAYAIEHYGTQNHAFTIEEFRKRYAGVYGENCDLIKISNSSNF